MSRSLAAALLVALLLLAGCGGGSDGEDDAEAGPTTTEETLPPDTAPDTAAIDFGQETALTDDGFVPATLVAIVDHDVTIRNASSQPREVVFRNRSVGPDEARTTGVLAPGDGFTFRPDTLGSYTFELAGDPSIRGAIQVDPGTFEG
jgi:hypothetical protein